jgi:hypothetical protein
MSAQISIDLAVEPFLLTVPRPRKLPEPTVVIPNFTKARPIPEAVINGSKEKEILAKKKEENKKKSMVNSY